jgi:hypothetical protein
VSPRDQGRRPRLSTRPTTEPASARTTAAKAGSDVASGRSSRNAVTAATQSAMLTAQFERW